MNLEYLKVFYVAANNKSFSQTAKDLHISQSSVSLQIKYLEEKWDAQLFDRTTKKISLTPAGEILYRQVKKILALMNETSNALQELKNVVHGDLKVGASLTVGEHLLPFIMAEFNQLYPLVNIQFNIFNSDQIVEKLNNQEINLGFIESMLSYPHIEQIPFTEDELIVVASPVHHEQIPDNIELEQLLAFPFVIREKGSGTRQVMEDCLRRNHLDPDNLQVVMELDHTEAIKSAVEAGLGISVLSKSAVKKELDLKTLKQVNINQVRLRRHFYMVYDQESLQLPSQKLIELIEKKYTFMKQQA